MNPEDEYANSTDTECSETDSEDCLSPEGSEDETWSDEDGEFEDEEEEEEMIMTAPQIVAQVFSHPAIVEKILKHIPNAFLIEDPPKRFRRPESSYKTDREMDLEMERPENRVVRKGLKLLAKVRSVNKTFNASVLKIFRDTHRSVHYKEVGRPMRGSCPRYVEVNTVKIKGVRDWSFTQNCTKSYWARVLSFFSFLRDVANIEIVKFHFHFKPSPSFFVDMNIKYFVRTVLSTNRLPIPQITFNDSFYHLDCYRELHEMAPKCNVYGPIGYRTLKWAFQNCSNHFTSLSVYNDVFKTILEKLEDKPNPEQYLKSLINKNISVDKLNITIHKDYYTPKITNMMMSTWKVNKLNINFDGREYPAVWQTANSTPASKLKPLDTLELQYEFGCKSYDNLERVLPNIQRAFPTKELFIYRCTPSGDNRLEIVLGKLLNGAFGFTGGVSEVYVRFCSKDAFDLGEIKSAPRTIRVTATAINGFKCAVSTPEVSKMFSEKWGAPDYFFQEEGHTPIHQNCITFSKGKKQLHLDLHFTPDRPLIDEWTTPFQLMFYERFVKK